MLFNKDFSRPFRFLLSFFISLAITFYVVKDSGFLQFIDGFITGSVQSHENGFFTAIYTFISFLGSPKAGILWILIIAFLMWGFKYKIQALWAMGTVFGGDVVDEIVKHLVRRPRPSGAHLGGFSFPSGHVFSTFLIISVIWLVVIPQIKRARSRCIAYVIAALWVFIVMISRIYLSAHYPTDTVGAVVMAYTWLQISEWLYIKYAPSLMKWRLTSHSYI